MSELEYSESEDWLTAGPAEPAPCCPRCSCSPLPCICDERRVLRVVLVPWPARVIATALDDCSAELALGNDVVVLRADSVSDPFAISRDDRDLAGRPLPRWVNDEELIAAAERALNAAGVSTTLAEVAAQ